MEEERQRERIIRPYIGRGAESGSRTRTRLPSAVFETAASAIPPPRLGRGKGYPKAFQSLTSPGRKPKIPAPHGTGPSLLPTRPDRAPARQAQAARLPRLWI